MGERFASSYDFQQQLLRDWPCRWNADASLEDVPCTNPNCHAALAVNRRTILFEYACIFFWTVFCSWAVATIEHVEVDKYDGCPFHAHALKIKVAENAEHISRAQVEKRKLHATLDV